MGYSEDEITGTSYFQMNYFANDYDPPEGKQTEPIVVEHTFEKGDAFQVQQAIVLGSPATTDNNDHNWDKHGQWDPLDLAGLNGFLPTGSLRAIDAAGSYSLSFEYEPEGLLSFGVGIRREPIFFMWAVGGIFASYGRLSSNPRGITTGMPLGDGYNNGFSGMNPIFEMKSQVELERITQEQEGLGYSEGGIKTYILPASGEHLPLSIFPIAEVIPELIEHPLFSNVAATDSEKDFFWRWWIADLEDPVTPKPKGNFAASKKDSPVANETLDKNRPTDPIDFTRFPQAYLSTDNPEIVNGLRSSQQKGIVLTFIKTNSLNQLAPPADINLGLLYQS